MSTALQSVKDFMETVRKSGLIPQAKLEAFEQDALPDIPEDDAPLAAAKLVRNGLLTNFQARNLLAGKYKGYTLGPYRVLEPIGSGGMSIVFLAEHVDLKRRVALKVLPASMAKDRATLERFYREAHAAAQLDHPNIVRIHDIMQSNGLHFIVMEFVEGINLHELLNKIGPMNHHQAVGYIAQAAAGLGHAHDKGFVHRDIKPSNLILDRQGHIKILDMGLAKSYAKDQDSLTKQLDEQAVVGTVDIISPEQALNDPVDQRSDIYSLGATMFMLMSGKPPFDGTTAQKLLQHQVKDTPSLTAIRQTIPPALSKVVAKMMAKKPEERYQSAAEVIEALTPWNSDAAPAFNLDGMIPDHEHDGVNAPATSKIRSGLRRTLKNLPPAPPSKTKVNPALPPSPKSRLALWGSLAAIVLLVGGGLTCWQLGLFDSGTSPLGPDTARANQPSGDDTTKTPVKKGPAPTPKQDPTPPKKNPPSPKSDPVAMPANATVLLDGSKLAPLDPQSLGIGTPQSIAVPGGDGWKVQVWRNESAGEWGVEEINGQRALWFRSPKGDAATELSTSKPSYTSNKQPQRRLRITYRTEGEATSTVSVRAPGGHTDETHAFQLAACSDRWRTVAHDLQTDRDEPLTIVFKNTNKQGQKLYVAAIALEAIPTPDQVLKYEATDSGTFKESVTATPTERKSITHNLNGWVVNSWKDSTIEVEAHELEGRACLSLKTVTGTPSLQMVNSGLPVRTKVGRHYTAQIEYRLEANGKATIQLRRGGNYPDRVAEQSLSPSDSWRTVGITYEATDEHPLMVFVQNTSANSERLFVRSVRVAEDVLDPKASAKILQPLDLSKVFNANGTEMIFSPTVKVALDFTDPGVRRFGGIPFRVPASGPMNNNIIVMHSRQGTLPPTLPKTIDIPIEAPAKKIHFLGGASGWGFPYGSSPMPTAPTGANRGVPKGTVSAIVRIIYTDGQQEDVPWRNGVELFDYNKRKTEEPGPKIVWEFSPPPSPGVGPRQFRLVTVTPKRTAKIQRLELIKSEADDFTAPIIVGITLER